MRRSDRELKDMADIVAIAKRETVCTVAFHDESKAFFFDVRSSTKYAVPFPQMLSKLVVDLQAAS